MIGKRTASMLVMALAAEGLLVSVAVARSGLAAGPPDQYVEPGPTPSTQVAAAPRVAPGTSWAPESDPLAIDREPARAPAVGRSDATDLTAATRPQRAPRPVRVQLDAVQLDAPVRPVGVEPDTQMSLPENPEVLGWYRFGAAPGTGRGATVLAGHLDSRRFGLGPLVRLRDVRPGDTFQVWLADGSVREYAVRRVARIDRQGLPDSIFARTGPERLHLITCGGAYDPDNGGYQQNLVVTAVPTG